MITEDAFYTLADRAHFLFAMTVVWGHLLFCGEHYVGYTIFGIIGGAAVKEYWWDENYETAEIRGSNTRDFLGYTAGALIAIGLYVLKVKL